MFSAVRNIENSEYARFGQYLHERHFAGVFMLAFFLHVMGAAVYYLVPRAVVEEIPVRVLNVKLGGKVNSAAITSDDVNRLFAKRRLAETAQVAEASPVTAIEPKKEVVEKRPEPEPKVETPKPEPVKQEPKPEPKKVEPPKQEVARAALETPKPKAEITPPPPPKPAPVKTVEKKASVKTAPKPPAAPKVERRQAVERAKPRRYVRESQLTAQLKPATGQSVQGEGSPLGNSDSASAEIQRRYTQTISLWIDKHKVYPEAARARGEGGKVILRIRINRQGRILRYLLEKSSGSDAIDRAITQMIDAANPLPAVPLDYPDNKPYLEFLIPINFIP